MGSSSGHTHPVQHPSTHGHLHVPGRSWIHRAPAATKLVALAVFMVVVAVTPRVIWPALIADITLVLVLLGWARVPIASIATRSLVVLPVVVLAALVPFVAGGRAIEVGPLSLSESGLWAAWNITIKATTGVLATILLTATTAVADIVEGLSRLPLPRLIVSITSLMFRYLDVIDDRLTKMRQAMVARCYDPRWLWQAKPIAQSAGAVFVRTYERGERIHLAMLARGYSGVMPDLSQVRISATAWIASLAPAAVAAGAWWLSWSVMR